MAACRNVVVLNISENPLGLKGAEAVADLLNPLICPAQLITKLVLYKCEVSDAGGVALARALEVRGTTCERRGPLSPACNKAP